MTRLPAPSSAVIGGLAAALTLGLTIPAAAQSERAPDVEAEAQAAPLSKGEQRLAKLLEGREAGEPVACIRTLPQQRTQTINGTAYVYGSGNTIYVQRTRTPDQIDNFDALVINRFNATRLCRYDVITAIDSVNGFFSGAVFFEDFVPYTKITASDQGEG